MLSKQYSKNYLRFGLCIFFLLEIAWSCSAWGYISIGTVSMSFIPTMVVLGAYVFGVRVGMMAGLVFGISSMLLATINVGGIPADAMFSPFISGKPIQSLILCYAPRILLGFMAGTGFRLVQSEKPRRWKLVCVTAVSIYLYAAVVFLLAAIMFPEIIHWGMLSALLVRNYQILLELTIPSLFILVFERIRRKPTVQNLVRQSNDGYNKIKNKSYLTRYIVRFTVLFMVTISGVFIEFAYYIRYIFESAQSGLGKYQQTQVDLLALQQVIGTAAFVLAVLGISILGYCYFFNKESMDKEQIQQESNRAARAQREADDASQVIDALASDFLNVFLVNPASGMARTIKLDGYVTTGIGASGGASYSFRKMVQVYVHERVYKEDQEKFLYALSREGMLKNLKEKDEYSMSYQVLEDGSIHYYQAKITKTEQPGIYVVGFQNIDSLMQEEMRKQKMYEEALEEAKKANRAKSDFLSRMSHDIRTPINGIVGMTHIVEKQSGNEQQVLAGIHSIQLLSQQLDSLVNDVLEMSRIESGRMELAHEPFHLKAVLRALAPAMEVMAETRSVLLAGSHYECQHEHVISSPTHIQRIMSNVVTNAIKYNRPGGTVECWLQEEPIDSNHSEYLFTVKDTGVGMSEEYLKQIFDPFTREQKGTDTYYSGTGLGMTIAKELVDKLGGSIAIESEQGVGTTVRVRLPLELTEEVESERVAKDSISLEGKRVLIVEDNIFNMRIAKYILGEEKAIVDTAENGQKAVEKFRTSGVGSYDLILMDIMMPGMNGLDATRAIRALDRPDAGTIPILAMTANAFEEDIRNCLEAGMNAHIAKPINVDKMLEQIAKVVMKVSE